ncbi:MAG: type 3 dihydrofolate reductase [Chloroflexi bacterium]|nr:type 3 dihydrofolate reductase [Chloroflexota bacterium]MCI0578644.1 type 3 dihydrofolate reductase [Chloroflexota bacterium]MCI0647217.1 type 3 dihydrofolate reductase [Chloroflexota bacterium]MCI0728943.1 type 3 dihydrofolate reductase [Chloroflexota bacterium]
MRLALIAAMDVNRVIGRDNQIPWRLPADSKRFKALTMGKPLILGRKTYESIGRPLPGRTNIVVTRDREYQAEGCLVVHSVDEALATAAAYSGADGEVMVGGGAVLYEALLARADRLYLTFIDAVFEGDTCFPAFDAGQWQEVAREAHPPDEKNPYTYTFVTYERRAAWKM